MDLRPIPGLRQARSRSKIRMKSEVETDLDQDRHQIVAFCARLANCYLVIPDCDQPYQQTHSLCRMALAGLVTVLYACLDMKSIILGEYHYMLYFLVLAMQPRMLMTVDENLKPLSVPVRVGQAVDVVGRAGRPKTITRFQTHSTPILLAAGERAELATEKYIPLTPVLEGFVILRENPDYCDGH